MAEEPTWVSIPAGTTLDAALAVLNQQVRRMLDLLTFATKCEIRVVTSTATLTLGVRQLMVRADATAGPFTVTLPRAREAAQRFLLVKRVSSLNTVTIAAASGDTIDGAASIALTSPWQVVRLIADADRAAWLLG